MKLFRIKKRVRTKSENDALRRASVDQDEKKKFLSTSSSFALSQNSNENPETYLSRKSSHYHHRQSNERVSNSNTVLYRENSRRYSNPFFTSARYGGSRASITVLPSSTNIFQQKQLTNLSRSVDRLHNKSKRRELRYEEHNDYIPPPLYSIECHPTIDHYKKSLNQSNYRRSQIDTYQLSSIKNRSILPRTYSSNIPISNSVQIMSKISSDNAYGKLSDCHSPLTPLENSTVKPPRRIESTYSQFPTLQEPVYANTQSLYDNILFPQSTTSKTNGRKSEFEKRSCASQTQLTWTMATFSSFVDLENQSIIVPQPDPTTLYSVVQHYQSYPPPSASSETIQQMGRISPRLQYIDDPNSSSYYQRPRSPGMVDKRDGSIQTHLTLAPTQDIDSNRRLFINDLTPSPISTGSSIATAHHHHHHRKHKTRHSSASNITTRDVGLQVNIQTVKKITFSSGKSDESSLTTRQLKSVETNTEPDLTKFDRGTSYEPKVQLVTSSSQTLDSPTTNIERQTKEAQTQNKTLRDQSIETNHHGLFLCDLSSLLKNTADETSSTVITKRKS